MPIDYKLTTRNSTSVTNGNILIGGSGGSGSGTGGGDGGGSSSNSSNGSGSITTTTAIPTTTTTTTAVITTQNSLQNLNTSTNAVDWLKKKTGTALKKVNRLEEKLNQAIGKASRTEDELFESHVNTFETQNIAAQQLNKELQRYINSIKEAQKHSKNFYEVLKQIYEPTWPQYNELIVQCQQQENYWCDYIAQLQTNINLPIQSYSKEFPEYKKQIEKRDNKLLDYDKARHTLSDLESSKKPDELRIHKAHIDLQEKKSLYDELNIDLHTRLPLLYESRKYVYGSTLCNLFDIEKQFHEKMCETKMKLNQICNELYELNKGLYQTTTKTTTATSQLNRNNTCLTVSTDCAASVIPPVLLHKTPSMNSSVAIFNANTNNNDEDKPPAYEIDEPQINLPQVNDPSANTTRFLYKVKATYPYEAKELDELTFIKDDIIDVVDGTLSENEELDEGWLIGIHEQSGKRGLFPENFTKRI